MNNEDLRKGIVFANCLRNLARDLAKREFSPFLWRLSIPKSEEGDPHDIDTDAMLVRAADILDANLYEIGHTDGVEIGKVLGRDQYLKAIDLLAKLLSAPGDHMTACDRTQGDSHPCTCGADAARDFLETP